MRNNDKAQLHKVNRLGVMGGTFDPIHNAHLVLAETALYTFSLDKVVFIPSRRPPHKESQAELDAEHRAVMTELAIAREPRFFLSRTELDRDGYSYAYDTLVYLRSLLPKDAQIYFITGADAILDVSTWYRAADLPEICRFIAAVRPGYDLQGLQQLPLIWQQIVDRMQIPMLEISSTDLRRRIQTGAPIRYLVPEPVEDYIYKHGLYQEQEGSSIPMPWDRNSLRERVQAVLSPKRFIHSVAVAELSERWAHRWSLDADRAYIAGLLHDIAREQTAEELLELAVLFGIPVDPVIQSSPIILHAEVAAHLVKWEWGVDDPDILEAIARHTIPEATMKPLAKLVYLADICEPNRRWWPGREKLLDLCEEDLDRAMVFAIEQTIEYLQEKGQTPHPHTMQVLEDFRRLVGATASPKDTVSARINGGML